MKLYDLNSSDVAKSTLLQQLRIWFEGSRRSFLIRGRKSERCRIATTWGKTSTIYCLKARRFICEYKTVAGNVLPSPGECGVNSESRIVGGSAAGLKGW
jgi:hypothetical protein